MSLLIYYLNHLHTWALSDSAPPDHRRRFLKPLFPKFFSQFLDFSPLMSNTCSYIIKGPCVFSVWPIWAFINNSKHRNLEFLLLIPLEKNHFLTSSCFSRHISDIMWHLCKQPECDITPRWVLGNCFVYQPYLQDRAALPLLTLGQYFFFFVVIVKNVTIVCHLTHTWLAQWLFLLSTCSWCVVSALAPLSCGSRRIIQVDAARAVTVLDFVLPRWSSNKYRGLAVNRTTPPVKKNYVVALVQMHGLLLQRVCFI